jgi:hypothetical protein
MNPPAWEVVSTDTGVQALLGANPTRFWPFGEADPAPELPYAVWQTVYGSPQNYLGDVPDMDSWGTQIDVYASEADAARATAHAIRSAVERSAHVVAYNGEFRDQVTRNYRYSFTVDWFVNR